MRLSTRFLTSLRDNSAEAAMVSHKLLGMPPIVTDWPHSLAAGRSVRQMEDVELRSTA